MISVQKESENDTDNNYRSCGKRSVQHNKRFGEEKKMSGSAKHWALKEYKQRGEHLKRKEEMNDIYDNLTKEQLIGLQKQIRWERGIAIEQLHQIGKEFGEKMDDVHKVVFCKDCEYWRETHDNDHQGNHSVIMECYYDQWHPQYRDADDFCSKGKKKDE